jgi:predicted AlkP superfamily phosphohydrolase/phosphomutase
MYRRFLERIEKKGELCRRLLKRDKFDLFVTVFAETHTASHQFWRHRDREQGNAADSQQNHELAHAIRDIYQAIDKQIGLLIEQLPENANVVIVSASGMEDHYPSIGIIDSFLRRLGYQADPEPSAAASPSPLNLVRRLVPESLRIAASRHLPRSIQERLTADNFRNGTNWHKSEAFSIPAHYNSFVRANLRGREPNGIIEPGKEYESLMARLEDDLSQLIDPVSDKSPISEILRSTVFGLNPNVILPDIFVKWKSSPYFRERLIHPKAELSQPVPGFFRDSEHSDVAFFAAAGPAVSARGQASDVSLLDLAPTFLTLMDEPVSEQMTGSVIEALAGVLTT